MLTSNIIFTLLTLAIGASAHLDNDHHNKRMHTKMVKKSNGANQHDQFNNSSDHQLEKRGSYSGRATYYATGVGACGFYSASTDFVVALNVAQYGDTSQASSWCGKTISITAAGKTVQATVVDACPSCPFGGLDMSQSLFEQFHSTDVGVFQMSWTGGAPSQPKPKPSTTSTSTTPTSTSTRRSSTSTSKSRTSTTSTSSTSSSSTTPSSSSSSTTSSSKTSPASSTASKTSSPDNLNGMNQILHGFFAMASGGKNNDAAAPLSTPTPPVA